MKRQTSSSHFVKTVLDAFAVFPLVCKFLKGYGGLRAIPMLARKVLDAWKAEGLRGLGRKIGAFEQKTAAHSLYTSGSTDCADVFGHLQILANGRKFMLVLDHMYGGGANAYRDKRIKEHLQAGGCVMLATWDFFNGLLRVQASFPDVFEPVSFVCGDLNDFLTSSFPAINYILLNDIVLWNNAIKYKSHYLALGEILGAVREIRVRNQASLEVDINDYYCICPSWTLVNPKGQYCGLPSSLDICRKCLSESAPPVPRGFDLEQWRYEWQKTFDAATEIRAFAQAPLQLLEKVFTLDSKKCRIISHTPLLTTTRTCNIPAHGPMRIGVVGDITRHKGADIVREVTALLDKGEEIFVIGTLEGRHPAGIHVHGCYDRHDLPQLMENYGITVCLIPSLWPETFCYTVQECEIAGMPLVVFPLGAQAENVKNYKKGVIAREISAAAALEALRSLDAKRHLSATQY